MLHTWKQDLGRHVHVHALVAGGALTGAGDWVAGKRGFLFPVKALSKVFRVRAEASGKTRRTLALPAQTFFDRFLLHVLPSGFKRIRHYGLLAPGHKARRLALARAALAAPAPDPAVIESVAEFMRRVARIDWNACPRCGKGRFVVTGPPPSAAGVSARGPPCA